MKSIAELQSFYEAKIAELRARIQALESRETAREVKLIDLKKKYETAKEGKP